MTYRATLGELERWAPSDRAIELIRQWVGDGKNVAVFQDSSGRRSFCPYEVKPSSWETGEPRLTAIYEGEPSAQGAQADQEDEPACQDGCCVPDYYDD